MSLSNKEDGMRMVVTRETSVGEDVRGKIEEREREREREREIGLVTYVQNTLAFSHHGGAVWFCPWYETLMLIMEVLKAYDWDGLKQRHNRFLSWMRQYQMMVNSNSFQVPYRPTLPLWWILVLSFRDESLPGMVQWCLVWCTWVFGDEVWSFSVLQNPPSNTGCIYLAPEFIWCAIIDV